MPSGRSVEIDGEALLVLTAEAEAIAFSAEAEAIAFSTGTDTAIVSVEAEALALLAEAGAVASGHKIASSSGVKTRSREHILQFSSFRGISCLHQSHFQTCCGASMGGLIL